MGIKPFHAEIIIREHLHRPLPHTVHLIGRQTVWLTEGQALELLKQHGIAPQTDVIERDFSTLGATRGGHVFISDRTFFHLLGVKKVVAVDCSPYEGAEIIANLNRPLPDSLANCADFIYGGSVLDNLFDPAAYIRNIARMLKPAGRVIDINVGNFHNNPYVLVSPAWMFDFFVANRFADCKLYLEEETPEYIQVYGLQVKPGDTGISNFGSASLSNLNRLIAIAEKAQCSLSDQTPNQDQYRSQEEWASYRQQLDGLLSSKRRYGGFFRPTARMTSASPIRRQQSWAYLGCYPLENRESFAALRPEDDVARIGLNSGIRIVEASYGLNLDRKQQQRPSGIPLCRGNVTDRLASLFNGNEAIRWKVDVALLGDPAPGLSKDLDLHYYFLQDPDRKLRHYRIEAEAHGKEMLIAACP